MDETYVKVAGRWRHGYRAIDQFGQVIDVFVSACRDANAARQFLERAVGATKRTPVEVVTDKAPRYPAVLEELVPAAWHRTDRYANNHIEADHGPWGARNQMVALTSGYGVTQGYDAFSLARLGPYGGVGGLVIRLPGAAPHP